jgi:DNA invertase Pin-like site-specific DNA recombinase
MDSTYRKKAVVFVRARRLGSNGRHPAIEAKQVEAQRDACLKIAERLGADIVEEYIEYGGTGKVERRPVVHQLLDRLRTDHGIDYLIVASLDRLARRRDDWAVISLELEAAHVELVTVPVAVGMHSAAQMMRAVSSTDHNDEGVHI